MSTLQILASVLILVSVVLSMSRLVLGPTTVDRLVAADTLGVIITAVLVALSAWLQNPMYLDIALVFATLSFVGTVAIARALEKNQA